MVESAHSRPLAIQNPSGGLRIWGHPNPSLDYVIGIDSASGGPDSHFAAACVIEAKTCELVAVWHERCDPKPWGKKMALLGRHYGVGHESGEALLSFEVAPSAHGATAQEHCQETCGYQRLYHERRLDIRGRPLGTRTGWTTDTRSKDRMVNRVRQALEEQHIIPFKDLIVQLRLQKWDQSRKDTLNRRVPADLFDSYAIALCSRDYAWREGILQEEIPKPRTYDERFWASYDQQIANKYRKPGKRKRRYAGPS